MVGLLAYIWAASQSQSGPITPRFHLKWPRCSSIILSTDQRFGWRLLELGTTSRRESAWSWCHGSCCVLE
jgi:hypothetical protein